jgi:FKBP-type peptidyl-prolyl cis-trans isomerase
LFYRRGTGEVIVGLDIAIGSMKRREQAEFIITPELAFGEMG